MPGKVELQGAFVSNSVEAPPVKTNLFHDTTLAGARTRVVSAELSALSAVGSRLIGCHVAKMPRNTRW